MRTLSEAFTDAETLLALQPKELGSGILELVHADGHGRALFSMSWAMESVETQNSPQWPKRNIFAGM